QRREKHPTLVPTSIATIPQIRMTRRILGEYTMVNTDDRKYMADSVGMVSDWRRRGPVYEVPFGSLYSAKVKNLICAGRCTSATEDMWDLMRVIPCCAVTGQAAGTAAALGEDFTALDVAHLQKILQENGVILHEQELPKQE
ncbi:MAG: FAD-dependent oxidoreductase, partial [Oscillospiraceae bacterium]|nr:FAD-dependent oxidoreductase [Oscillospiraceae bacterium]